MILWTHIHFKEAKLNIFAFGYSNLLTTPPPLSGCVFYIFCIGNLGSFPNKPYISKRPNMRGFHLYNFNLLKFRGSEAQNFLRHFFAISSSLNVIIIMSIKVLCPSF